VFLEDAWPGSVAYGDQLVLCARSVSCQNIGRCDVGFMQVITLELLRRALGDDVVEIRAETIKVGASPSQVHRVFLTYAPDTLGPASVIVKTIAAVWAGDPFGGERELYFYRDVAPLLGLARPRVYLTDMDADTGMRVLVMEDLALGYRFFQPEHMWTSSQARCMLRAYARLHSRGYQVLNSQPPPAWLFPPYRERLLRRDIPGLARAVVQRGRWTDLPSLDRLYATTCQDLAHTKKDPVTLLHNDVYPPKLAFPRMGEGEGVLIDWEMVGSGPAELDLAYMFLQPYRSHQALDRQEMLAYYWGQRALLGDVIPSLRECQERQWLADRVMALWLVPVAHKVALVPYPSGSAPCRYWEQMFAVLYERLVALARGEW